MTSNSDIQILLIDDDLELCALLDEYLSNEEFEVTAIHDGQQGVDKMRELANAGLQPSAIILDYMLPSLQGLDVLRELRKFSATPVLMLTARGSDIDRIIGLEAGADDYLPKPCNPRELVARLRAILRRAPVAEKTQGTDAQTLYCHGLSLNPSRRTIQYGEESIDLTSAEFNTLLALMMEQGSVVSKESLTESALGRKLTLYDRSIDVHMSSVRKKLSNHLGDKEIIKTVRGSGYILISD